MLNTLPITISAIHASGHLSASLAIRLGFGLEHHGCGDLLGQNRTYFLRIAVAGLMAPITATSVFGSYQQCACICERLISKFLL